MYYFLNQFFPYSDLIIYQSKHYIKISLFCSMTNLSKIFVIFHIKNYLVWVRLGRISPLNLYLEMVPHNVRAIFLVFFWSLIIPQQRSAWVHHWHTMLFPYLASCFFPILRKHILVFLLPNQYCTLQQIIWVWMGFFTCSAAFLLLFGEVPHLYYLSLNLREEDYSNAKRLMEMVVYIFLYKKIKPYWCRNPVNRSK